jgi:hypothetical protein
LNFKGAMHRGCVAIWLTLAMLAPGIADAPVVPT